MKNALFKLFFKLLTANSGYSTSASTACLEKRSMEGKHDKKRSLEGFAVEMMDPYAFATSFRHCMCFALNTIDPPPASMSTENSNFLG